MYAFEFHRPTSINEASALLVKSQGKLVAGGQSLVAAMKLRLANPGALVDLSGIPELSGIKSEGKAIVIGATTRHAQVAESREVKEAIPALATSPKALVIGRCATWAHRRGAGQQRPGGLLSGSGDGSRGDGAHQQAHHCGGGLLQGHVLDGAARRRNHHVGQLPDSTALPTSNSATRHRTSPWSACS
jgi:hypothetical protein